MAVEKTTMEDKKLLTVDESLVVESTTKTNTSATSDQVDNVDKVDKVDKDDVKEKSTTNNSLAENITMKRYEPVFDRAADDDDEIFNKVDVSELYFRVEEPYDIPPLSKYFLCEWSEAEHLFRPAMEFAEEVFGEWSPCPSPSRSSVGL